MAKCMESVQYRYAMKYVLRNRVWFDFYKERSNNIEARRRDHKNKSEAANSVL